MEWSCRWKQSIWYANDGFIIAKLHACGTDLSSLKLLQDYLSNRRQREKVDSEVAHGRGSSLEYHRVLFLGPISFNIFMCDMFLFLLEAQFTDYADGNTPFMVRNNIADVISDTEEIGEKLNLALW